MASKVSSHIKCIVIKNGHKIRAPTNQNPTSIPTVLEVILPSPVCKMPPRSCEDTNERKDLQLKHLHSYVLSAELQFN